MQTLINFWLNNHFWLIPLVQLIPIYPLFKVILAARDKLQRVEIVELDLAKFKNEIRQKLKETEKTIEDGLDELTQDILEMERKVEGENKAFNETLHNINITLTKIDSTVKNLNDNLTSSKDQLNRMFDRVFKDFDDHKKDIKEQIRDLKISKG